MEMTRGQYEEIKRRYADFLLTDEDRTRALTFVQDLLAVEARATQTNCPYATNTIDRLLKADMEVYSLQQEIENESFTEEKEA